MRNDPASAYAEFLTSLRAERRNTKRLRKLDGLARRALSTSERELVLSKTGGRCHICGGTINGPWHADHVLSHSAGGKHAVDNYLAAHAVCNNYRWDYTESEFQEILKLGVWARTQVEKSTPLGREIASRFSRHEERRRARQKTMVAEGHQNKR